MKTLAFTHLIGNGLILYAGYYWLGVGESTGGLVLWSAVVFLVALAAALWLHGSALVFFAHRKTNALFTTARHLFPLVCVALFAIGLYWLLSYLEARFGHQAFVIGSYATMKSRKPVAPSSVMNAWHLFVAVLRWLIVSVLLLPLAASVAERGWSGFSVAAFKRALNPLYWVSTAALLAIAIYLPWRLVNWVPALNDFNAQLVSVAVRFAIAYLLLAAGLLALEYMTSKGLRVDRSQSSSAL